MKLIYSNFDSLDISFQGILPKALLSELCKAKEFTQNKNCECLIRVGKNKQPINVAQTGARGGYAFIFDTGIDGETWFIANSENIERWNLRVSVKSLTLALLGYDGAKKKVLDFLDNIKATGNQDGKPTERLSRFDFCVDYASDHFSIRPELFLAHSNSTKAIYESSTETIYRGRNIETIRIGKMPSRQVTIYNKTKEIQVHQKQYWHDIWDLAKEDKNKTIWRVEIRAGKKELDNWNIKSFADFESMAGDVVIKTLEAIRYVKPSKSDGNKSRWKLAPLWKRTIKTAKTALAPYITNANRKKIIKDARENIKERLKKHIVGTSISYAVACGLDVSEIPTLTETIENDIFECVLNNKSQMITKYENAQDRYVFLEDGDNE
jgi:hypothetical protein